MGMKFSIRNICSVWLGLALVILSAQAGEEVPPWKFTPQKRVLENGLTLIIEKDQSTETAFLQILIRGGKKAEPEGKEGLSFLTTRLAVEIPTSSDVQTMMKQASRVSVLARGDFSLISIECLSSSLDDTLRVLSKIVLRPLFSGLRIDAVKKSVLHQSEVENEDSMRIGHVTCLEAFFGKSGYGGSIFGDETSLKAIKKSDIVNFHKSYFTGPNLVMAASSDLDTETLIAMLDKYFSKMGDQNSPEVKPPVILPPKEKRMLLEKDNKQTFVALAFPLPKASPESFAMHYLLENLLGKGSGSRLWRLRSEEKLAYNVECRVTQMVEAGVLEAFLETDNQKRGVALESLRGVLSELFIGGIDEEELLITKTVSKANFLRANETRAARMMTLALFEGLGLGYEYYSQLFSELDGLTLKEVNTQIKNLLDPGKAVEVVVGSKGGEEILPLL